MVILSFLPLFIFVISQTTHEAPQEVEKSHFHVPLSHLYRSLFSSPTCSPPHLVSLTLSCSPPSFMYRSQKPATYHKSLERLSNKSRGYMPDLTGHTHKDHSVSLSLSDFPHHIPVYPSRFLFQTHFLCNVTRSWTLALFCTHTGPPQLLFSHNGISGVIPPLLLSGHTTNPLTIDSAEY